MKPLSEWTAAELREQIYDGHFDRSLMLDELLRRERDRCAVECDKLAAAEGYPGYSGHMERGEAFEKAAASIRELK